MEIKLPFLSIGSQTCTPSVSPFIQKYNNNKLIIQILVKFIAYSTLVRDNQIKHWYLITEALWIIAVELLNHDAVT